MRGAQTLLQQKDGKTELTNRTVTMEGSRLDSRGLWVTTVPASTTFDLWTMIQMTRMKSSPHGGARPQRLTRTSDPLGGGREGRR